MTSAYDRERDIEAEGQRAAIYHQKLSATLSELTECQTAGLAPFKRDNGLLLMPAPNGGWVVSEMGLAGQMPRPLAAFSNTGDLLKSLNDVLNTSPMD